MIPIGVVCLHYGLLVSRSRAMGSCSLPPRAPLTPAPAAAPQAKEQVYRYDQSCINVNSNSEREAFLWRVRHRRAAAARAPAPARPR